MGKIKSNPIKIDPRICTTIHFKKHPEDDYFIIHLKKVLLAWIFNANINCGTPYKQAEINALRYVSATTFDRLYLMTCSDVITKIGVRPSVTTIFNR